MPNARKEPTEGGDKQENAEQPDSQTPAKKKKIVHPDIPWAEKS
jgi:hypothetical protein